MRAAGYPSWCTVTLRHTDRALTNLCYTTGYTCDVSLPLGLPACAGNGYLANVAPSEFAGLFEEELPVSLSGQEWLAEHEEHWDSATQVCLYFRSL